MRLIKAFLAGLIGLFVFITLFTLLIPSRVRVSRVVLINNASSGEVYRQIADFTNWKNWHPAFTADSATLSFFPTGIVGNDSAYRILHRGREVIIKTIAVDSTTIKFLFRAKGENDIENDIVITPVLAQKSVQVEWRALTRLPWYPWEKIYGIFIDKITGPGYEIALNGLKTYIEKSPGPAN